MRRARHNARPVGARSRLRFLLRHHVHSDPLEAVEVVYATGNQAGGYHLRLPPEEQQILRQAMRTLGGDWGIALNRKEWTIVTSREAWAKRVERWKASGLTAAEFASRHGIAATSLKWWKWRLGSRDRKGVTGRGRVRFSV